MLQIGKNITAFQDKLEKIGLQQIYHIISNRKSPLKTQIEQLRTIKTVDEKQYRKLKTRLPYFTCARFSPPFRKKDNFAAIEFFVLDIDHLHKNNVNPNLIREKLALDERIYLLFRSPGYDGLKIVCRLNEKCFDPGKYSMFYKIFAKQFATQYNLQNCVDLRTSDVTRACFISFDPQAYFNHRAQTVDINTILTIQDQFELKQINKQIDADIKKFEKQNQQNLPTKENLNKDTLQEIRQTLNPKRKKKEKVIFVPEKLNEVIETVVKEFEQRNIKVAQITNINYGKKIRVEIDNYFAELNLFYGKKGFTVVKTPKRQSNTQLLDIAYDLLCNIFY